MSKPNLRPATLAVATLSCQERSGYLRLCPLFSNLPEWDIAHLANHSSVVDFEQGQTLVYRGQRTEYLLLVMRGVVHISLSAPSGQEFILGMAGRSMLLGEWVLAKEKHQPFNLIAHEPVTALRIPRDLLLGVKDELSLTRAANQLLTERFFCTLQSLEDIALFSLRQRLARLLARMHKSSQTYSCARTHRYSQSILALMSGGTRPRVNEHLQYFRQLGAIDIHCGSVLVREAELLAKLGDDGRG